MFTYVGLGNAPPHSSDRNGGGGNGVGRGWGGGDDGVGTARSAAGAARLYNLRLPSEGLRQGHGRPVCGPAPGLKGYRPCRRPLFDFSWEAGLCSSRSAQAHPCDCGHRIASMSFEGGLVLGVTHKT